MTLEKHAFLVLAHQDEAMLLRLVQRLSSVGTIFVHIDAKTDVSQWNLENLDCTFAHTRVAVYWAGWSMVEATVSLMETALEDSSVARLTLLSGSHYPIISNSEISRRSRSLSNVIASRVAPNMPDGSRPESQYERRFYETTRPDGLWARLKNGFMNQVVFYHRPLKWRGVAPSTGMRAGEQFWSIEREFAEYCVQTIRSAPPLIDYFKKIVGTDEKVFATLFGEYSGQVSLEGTTYSKWAGGRHPTPLTKVDLLKAAEGGQFWFARKFSSRDSALLDWLDQL